MTHYECCYSSGRQFVFAESRRWIVRGVVAVAILGLVVGLSIGITLSVGGLLSFNLVMGALACLTVYEGHMSMFRRVSSSVDVSSYIIGNIALWALFVLLIGAVRLSWQSGLGAINTTALLSVGGVLLFVLLYGYANLCLQEDERKHHLGVCSPGDSLDESAQATAPPNGVEDLRKFFVWIVTGQWVRDSSEIPPPVDEEGVSGCAPNVADTITIQNHTLKLIKVCLYAQDDLICWVPFGGISGRCVALVHAEDSKVFDLRGLGASQRSFQLKVFQPGVFDKELACFTRAHCGQSFKFYDVEGMVRRSRVLSSPAATAAVARPLPSFAPEDSEDDLMSPVRMAVAMAAAAPSASASDGAGSGVALASSGWGGGGGGGGRLRRIGSGNLAVTELDGDALASSAAAGNAGISSGLRRPQALTDMCGGGSVGLRGRDQPGTPPSVSFEARRAGVDEIVLRNRSNQEIRLNLFNENDYCTLVPLLSECVAPHEERRFCPSKSPAREYTLKVYSVGPGAKEITYFTVARGCAYVFCDSLLS